MTASRMMFSNAVISTSYVIVVPRNLQSGKLSSISLLHCKHFLLVSDLAVLMNVLKPFPMAHLLSFCGGSGRRWFRCYKTIQLRSDFAGIYRCKAAMKFQNSPFSMLPSQFFGIRSLLQYGLAAHGAFAERFCIAVSMLLN